MVTHGNLAANIRCIMEHGLQISREDVGISWLPLYHDMGLIGFVLAPLMHTVPIVYLSPLMFLKRPLSWFQAFTRHHGTIAYAPNFAYAVSVKRIRERDLEGIDLRSWRVAGCGAEPIRYETLTNFTAAFERVGFNPRALIPSYGMAESALAVAFSTLGSGVRHTVVDAGELQKHELVTVDESHANALPLVSCGKAFQDHKIAIFSEDDAASSLMLGEGRVGEIRIAGPSVMPGYWEDEELTRGALVGGYLRTGDLGFLKDDELYVCGRIKELIIINGRNYYPQDLEWEASQVPGVRKGNVIAFAVRPANGPTDREKVVLAAELQDASRLEDAATLVQLIRKQVQEGTGLVVDDVLILPAGTLPKTSSGKLQRTKARELYEQNELKPRASSSMNTKLLVAKEAVRSQLSYLKVAARTLLKPKRPL